MIMAANKEINQALLTLMEYVRQNSIRELGIRPHSISVRKWLTSSEYIDEEAVLQDNIQWTRLPLRARSTTQP